MGQKEREREKHTGTTLAVSTLNYQARGSLLKTNFTLFHNQRQQRHILICICLMGMVRPALTATVPPRTLSRFDHLYIGLFIVFPIGLIVLYSTQVVSILGYLVRQSVGSD